MPSKNDVSHLLSKAREHVNQGLHDLGIRPDYLGITKGELSWTRTVLTHVCATTDFFDGNSPVTRYAADALEVLIAGNTSIVVVDYGLSYSDLVLNRRYVNLVFPAAKIRLWARDVLRPLWIWQERDVDSPAEIAFDTRNVLITFSCPKGKEYETESHIRLCLSAWLDEPIRQRKIYVYPIEATMARGIGVSGCFDTLNHNHVPLVGWPPLSNYGLNTLPDYLKHLTTSPLTRTRSHWWTAARFFDEAIRRVADVETYQTLVSFVTILESLMGSKTNKKVTLAQRVAGVCGESVPTASIGGITVADFIKDVWDVRSDIVHGNIDGNQVMTDWITRVGNAADQFTYIVRHSLIRYTMLNATRRHQRDRGAMNAQFGQWVQRGVLEFPINTL